MVDAMYDAAVVGTGPAGAMAARVLARAGRRVVLIEKQTLPRYKTCGGGVVPRAAALMELDITPAIERVSTRIELHVPGVAPRTVDHGGQPLIYMTMRAALDAMLTQAAVDAGAELRTACTVTGLSEQHERAVLHTSDGDIAARFIIAADGARSPIARMAGWRETRQFAPALECEVTPGDAAMRRLGEAVRFDFDVVRGGYAWVFPKRDHLSIGLGRLRSHADNLNAGLERYLHMLDIDAAKLPPEAVQRHGYVVPIAPRTDGLARGRVLLVGDAAGLADPVAAEGISHALISGTLAAEAAASCDDPAAAGWAYEAAIAERIIGELDAARVLSRLLYDHPLLRTFVLRLRQRRAAEAMVDVFAGRRSFVDVLRRRPRWMRYWLMRKRAA